jgi:hypothetical protein
VAGFLKRVRETAAGVDVPSKVVELLDALSAEAYERGEATGTLLLCSRGDAGVEVQVELAEPVPLRSTRAARKALELGRGAVAPLCDGGSIWGVGRARPGAGAVLEVQFQGRGRWRLRRGGETILTREARPPVAAPPALDRERLDAALREVLGARARVHPDRIAAALDAVLAVERGITVIVSPGAASEARRLAAQGTSIAPRALEPGALQAATGIGGAILLDPGGTCHAIGVILDGVASERGERSRGSRFNSAANYVRGRRGTLAVVVSDDGSVDLLRGGVSPPAARRSPSRRRTPSRRPGTPRAPG